MLDVKNPELSVEELMAKIKSELAAAENKHVTKKLQERSSTTLIAEQLRNGRLGLSSNKDQSIPFRDSYSLAEILDADNEIFIRNVYRAVLQREPEPGGADSYLRQLHGGTLSQVEIVGVLRESPEGRRQAIHVSGLRLRYAGKKFFHLPIIGYAARWVTAWVRLPLLVRNFEQVHATVHYRFRAQSKEVETLTRRTEALAGAKAAADNRAEAAEKRLDAAEKMSVALRAEIQSVAARAAQLAETKAEKIDNSNLDPFWVTETSYKRDDHSRVVQAASAAGHDVFYSAFQDIFYNSNIVSEKQKGYLPFINRSLATDHMVLDCGCGRGEFLTSLRNAGLPAIGVDTNAYEVEQLANKGFDVFEGDLLEHLTTSDALYAGISAFQVVEHLDMKYLTQFLGAAMDKLAVGGVLILETVNPHSPYALSNFYQDPTHVKPLPPELLQFLIEWQGFSDIKVVYSSLVPVEARIFPDRRMNYQDYAVIGYKR